MLDPHGVLVRGDVREVREQTLAIKRVMAPGGEFLMGPGCALPPNTPPELIHVVMECAWKEGAYSPDGSLPQLE